MPGHERLSAAFAERIADAFGLGSPDDWGPVPAGTINDNHWLKAGGSRWFVRINAGKSPADVRWEAELVAELAARGVPTPPPRLASGEPLCELDGQLISVFPWLPGHHLDADQVRPTDAAQVGAALATLHTAGTDLAERFARDGIYTFEHIVQRHRDIASDPRLEQDQELASAVALADSELVWLSSAAAERRALPGGIIHGDLFRDNVLFEDERISALIDFEQASRGSFIYDLAVCLNAWCYAAGQARLDCMNAMVAGYDSRRTLGADERDMLWVELRAAAVRFMITRITDVHLAGLDLPGKDYRSYRDRLMAWQALGVDGARRLGTN